MANDKVQAGGAPGARGVYVDDTKVVGARANAITNTASVVNSNNVQDMPTKVNDILVALRAHGLIAP